RYVIIYFIIRVSEILDILIYLYVISIFLFILAKLFLAYIIVVKNTRSIKLYNVILLCYILSIDVTVQVLKENVGKIIMIKLKGDKVVKGILNKFDQHMNLVLSDAT